MKCFKHRWHPFVGPIHMVVPQGRIVEECCKCRDMRVVDPDHRGDA